MLELEMRDIDNFLAAVVISCLLPVFPLGIELLITKSLSWNSLLIATLMYVIAASYVQSSALVLVLGGIVSISLAIIYGIELGRLAGNTSAMQLVTSFGNAWYAWSSLVAYAGIRVFGCYRK